MIRLRIIVLSVLAGATLAVGGIAAILFPVMKALDPTLPYYSRWSDPHAFIAAGSIASQLFRTLDWLALGVAVVAAVSLIPRGARPDRSAAGMAVWISVGLLVVLVALNWLWLRPTMYAHLQEYWQAANSGLLTEGRAEKAEFMRLHPIATGMLVAQLGLALTGAALTRPAGQPARD